MNTINRTVVAVVLVGVVGCTALEEEAEQEIKDSFERLEYDIRLYQTEVLFPALAAASEEQRLRYREIIGSRLQICGDEPEGRLQMKRWDRCVDEINGKAAT